MLIHVTPRFYTCEYSGPNVELVDLRIDALGVLLRGGKELATRRPYPNKRYVVGCRKIGQKAIDGILFETNERIPEYTVETRWSIHAEFIATHRVRYVVLDDDFDGVTDCMVLWHAMSQGLGGWRSRWPDEHKASVPASAQPRMQLSQEPQRGWPVTDRRTGQTSFERAETFPLPSVERERLLSTRLISERIPSIESAFRVSQKNGAPVAA